MGDALRTRGLLKLAVAGIAILFAICQAFAQSSTSLHDKTFLLSSPDVASDVSLDRIQSCLQRLTAELNQDERQLPTIVVYHVSRKLARAAFVEGSFAIRRKVSPKSTEAYYEVWLVDKPRLEDEVVALEAVVEAHFRLKLTDSVRQAIMLRTARRESATIAAFEGK